MFLGLQNQCKITKKYAMASDKEINLIDPIHQFAITKLADIKIGNIDISFTNSSQFMFIFFCNLVGLIPYTFTVTSHIIVTFAFAGLIFIGVTLVGFIKNGLGYLRMFYPKGVPLYMAPIIIPIEVISYLTKPVSLSVRLMANMLAGLSIIKIFAGFIVIMGFFGIIPLAG